MKTIRHDLEWAGIAYKDDDGRQLDLRAFCATHATRLLRAGLTVYKARLLTRHAVSRTLEQHCIMLGYRDAVTAMEAVPPVAAISYIRENGCTSPRKPQ